MVREKATARRMGWTSPCRSVASPSPSVAVVDFLKFLLQPVPAAGDLDGIVEIHFDVFVGDLFLESLGDIFLIHGQHQHFVIR